jgi:hypothetical protein
MDKKSIYTGNQRNVAHRARNARMRSLGIGGGSGSTVVVSTTGNGGSGSETSHTHANKSTLDAIGMDGSGYVYLSQEETATDESGHSWTTRVSSKAKAGYADRSGKAAEAEHSATATEAEHAATARDVDEDSPAYDRWLRKDRKDETDYALGLKGGATFGSYDGQGTGGRIDAAGVGDLTRLVVRELMGSADFVDGLTGSGWRVWLENKLSHLTVDRLTVRQVMTVIELLVDRVRSVGGQICVSGANGKIAKAELSDGYWRLTMETESGFAAHDLMRCATWSQGKEQRGYWVEIAKVEAGVVWVLPTEFEAGVEPAAGDEVVLMGNTQNTERQNLLLLSATEDGRPRIDVMDGVKEKSFAGCLRVRLGRLDGIEDDHLPAKKQPTGNGLWGDNVYLRGTFLMSSGEDVETRIEATEAKIETAVEGLRQDFTEEKGYLTNATFGAGLEAWDTQNEAVFFTAGGLWLWGNGKMLTHKGDGAWATKDAGRTVVQIRNKYIKQRRAEMRSVPTYARNAEGAGVAKPVYLSFYYKVTKAGRLRIGFEGMETEGWEDFEPMAAEEDLEVTEGYQQYTCEGAWNGTGDFTVGFTGEMYLYMLVLSTDRIGTLAYRYRTLFEQSERLVKLSAAVYDKDETLLQETGLVARPEGAGLYAQTADGKVALVGTTVTKDGSTVVQLTAEHLQLEGLTTVNENFRVKEDGSIETRNAKVNGYLWEPFTEIGESDAEEQTDGSLLLRTQLHVDATFRTVRLPVGEDYVGARVLVMDSYFQKTRVAMPSTVIKTEDNSKIYSGLFAAIRGEEVTEPQRYMAASVTIDCGVVELVLQKVAYSYDTDGNASEYGLRWVLLSNSCASMSLSET